MINLTNPTDELHELIAVSGHTLRRRDNNWIASDEIAVQAIINSYDALPSIKADKITDLKAEGLARINVVYPAINDWDDLDLVRDQWLSIAPAARQATAEFQSMIDIFSAGKDAATEIDALITIAEVEAYNVVIDPVWP